MSVLAFSCNCRWCNYLWIYADAMNDKLSSRFCIFAGDFLNAALVNGVLAVRMRQNGETLFTSYDPSERGQSFCDGRWHTVNSECLFRDLFRMHRVVLLLTGLNWIRRATSTHNQLLQYHKLRHIVYKFVSWSLHVGRTLSDGYTLYCA